MPTISSLRKMRRTATTLSLTPAETKASFQSPGKNHSQGGNTADSRSLKKHLARQESYSKNIADKPAGASKPKSKSNSDDAAEAECSAAQILGRHTSGQAGAGIGWKILSFFKPMGLQSKNSNCCCGRSKSKSRPKRRDLTMKQKPIPKQSRKER